MPNIEEILKRAKPRQKSVWICVAGDLLSEVDRLERELREVGEGWSPDSLASCDPREKIAKRIKTVREAMKKAEVEFVFRSIGDRAWSDLVAAHPPKKQGPGGQQLAWDPDTFPRALVSASAVDPVMTPEQLDELFEVLNEGQRSEMFDCAYAVNTEATSIPFSVTASGILSSLTDGK
ncbi:hypothetical protein [Streptomyces zhihengii]|uniref:Uncharacterized protein n=1 Tax=Streptomyces zhihengii TaxID=1818004 RepID=A0ABS2UTZ0_9ACTN|nr:hypothetical protein [Streptomyces zhihengii]MBM9621031.1 hypothetical protein [Streptomyces zhihengii]